MLRRLDRPVRVTVVYVEPSPEALAVDLHARLMAWAYGQAMDMLNEFKAYSPLISVKELDVNDPKQVEELRSRVDIPGSCIVFESGETHDVIPLEQIAELPSWRGGAPKFTGEAAFAGALAKIMERKRRLVYFLTGHGERPIEGRAALPEENDLRGALASERYSLSRLVRRLKGDNFESRPLVLEQTGTVPQDCDVLVVAGPRTALSEQNIKAIRDYLDNRAGRALIMVDSELGPRSGRSNLNELLSEYGLKARTDAVVMFPASELALTGRGLVRYRVARQTAIVTREGYLAHPVTRDLQNYTVQLVRCAPLEILNARPRPSLSTRKLLSTVKESWGECTAAQEMDRSTYDAGSDLAGPVIVGAVVEPAAPPGAPPESSPQEQSGPRLVVLGSSLSFVNYIVEQNEANLYLALNAINWLAGKSFMVGIPPKDVEVNMLSLSPARGRLARWLFVVVLPGCIVALGVAVWLVRRR